MMDFHTHNLEAEAGKAIINMPSHWLLFPEDFTPREDALYSAGVHPWWTEDTESALQMLKSLPRLLSHPQVVAVGECGLDAMRGARMEVQEEILLQQLLLSEQMHLPVTLHVVKAFDRLLRINKRFAHKETWTIHGFRGKPALARQLLAAGFDLSFGRKRNEESYQLTPPDRRREETDECY